MSNDGELTNLVTHPRYGITKRYVAKVEGAPRSEVVRRLMEGIELEDGQAQAVSARIVDSNEKETLLELVMVEGRNREVRRMLDAVGHPVVGLVRTAIGPLSDKNLKPGESRQLTAQEIQTLLSSVSS